MSNAFIKRGCRSDMQCKYMSWHDLVALEDSHLILSSGRAQVYTPVRGLKTTMKYYVITVIISCVST